MYRALIVGNVSLRAPWTLTIVIPRRKEIMWGVWYVVDLDL